MSGWDPRAGQESPPCDQWFCQSVRLEGIQTVEGDLRGKGGVDEEKKTEVAKGRLGREEVEAPSKGRCFSDLLSLREDCESWGEVRNDRREESLVSANDPPRHPFEAKRPSASPLFLSLIPRRYHSTICIPSSRADWQNNLVVGRRFPASSRVLPAHAAVRIPPPPPMPQSSSRFRPSILLSRYGYDIHHGPCFGDPRASAKTQPSSPRSFLTSPRDS